MPEYEVEYAITGYGTVTVYAANEDQAWDEFSCNSKKDLLEGLPELVQITEIESDDEEAE